MRNEKLHYVVDYYTETITGMVRNTRRTLVKHKLLCKIFATWTKGNDGYVADNEGGREKRIRLVQEEVFSWCTFYD